MSVVRVPNIGRFGFVLLPKPHHVRTEFFLFSDLKKMPTGKKFSGNEDVIAYCSVFKYFKQNIIVLQKRYGKVGRSL